MADMPAPAAASPETIDTLPLRPLVVAYMACTMAMMAFVAMIGPVVRVLGLAPWQAGATVTVAGVLWMLLARPWGRACDRHGRRAVLLAGTAGFAVSYLVLTAVIDVSLMLQPGALVAFAALMLARGAIGVFYAAIPTAGTALVADHVAPARRAGAMATLGAANAVGMVAGPGIAALLAPFGLHVPLYAMAVLPIIALVATWRFLPRDRPASARAPATLPLGEPRLRHALVVAFVAMACVAIAQITVGFFVLDRFGLEPGDGARIAGIALTVVGVALILSQIVVRRLGWPPARLVRIGGAVAALGFASTALATSPIMLWASYFVAAAGMGWVFPAFSALAANAVEPHEQGAAAGSLGAAQGLGVVVGPLAGASLYGLSPSLPYLVVGVMLAAVAAWPARSRPSPANATI